MGASIEFEDGVIWLRGAVVKRKPFDESKVRRSRGRFARKPQKPSSGSQEVGSEQPEPSPKSGVSPGGYILHSFAVRETVYKSEDRLRKIRSHEEYRVVDPDTGKVVMKKKGEQDHIAIEPDERKKMRGKVFLHNHPMGYEYNDDDSRAAGNSFSGADIAMAIACELKEMRAVSPGYRHSLRFPEGWIEDKYQELIENTPSSRKYNRDEIKQNVESGIFTKGEAVSHALWPDIHTIRLYSRQEFQGEIDEEVFYRGKEAGAKLVKFYEAEAAHIMAQRVTEELGLMYSREIHVPWDQTPWGKAKRAASGRKQLIDLLLKAARKFDESRVKRDEKGRFSEQSASGSDLGDNGREASEQTRQLVLKKEDEIRSIKTHEEGVVIDPSTGRVVHHIKGETSQIEFPIELNGTLNGMVFTHNHPAGWNYHNDSKKTDIRGAGNSFSVPDIRSMVFFDLLEMRAVSPGFRHSMKKPDGFVDKTYDKIERELSGFDQWDAGFFGVKEGKLQKSQVVAAYVGIIAGGIYDDVRRNFQDAIDRTIWNEGIPQAESFAVFAEAVTAHVAAQKIAAHFGFTYKREAYKPWEEKKNNPSSSRKPGKKSTSLDQSSLMPIRIFKCSVSPAISASTCLTQSAENVTLFLTKSHSKSGTVTRDIESHTPETMGLCLSLDRVMGLVLKQGGKIAKFDESKVRRDQLGRFATQEGRIKEAPQPYQDLGTEEEIRKWILKHGAERIIGSGHLDQYFMSHKEGEVGKIKTLNQVARALDKVLVANGIPKLEAIEFQENYTKSAHAWVGGDNPRRVVINLASFEGGPDAYAEKVKKINEFVSSKEQHIEKLSSQITGLKNEVKYLKQRIESYIKHEQTTNLKMAENMLTDLEDQIETLEWQKTLDPEKRGWAGRDIQELVTHELGHVLHIAIQKSADEENKSIDTRIGGDVRDRTVFGVPWGPPDARSLYFLALTRRGLENASKISRYAKTNSMELFAECFGMYFSGRVSEVPSEILPIIEEVIERNTRKAGGK